ncbi:TIGR04325 family methyltransferase [Arcticibacter tournemirensis]|uniref:Methyltransferase, TIGR04325 family n=1 Tax=Arcticibacter tournemirensis TaxID=699437 RepID=A0A4V1KI12_9SPHI|nr:TIGR04325 family methyltransferase [Arcticibacter tournemirensis]RXF69082.1 methyltransferase, TIGR04325 family [Arcticibacter tournemirensis]
MIKRFFSKKAKNKYGWFGNFSSWEDACRATTGYDAGIILEKTRNAILQVKLGKAVYERDSVVFDKKQYPFPLISFMLHSAIRNKKPLHIIDFGGSLGSTYFQVKEFLHADVCASWNVIEQDHYVSCGKSEFEDDTLHFFSSIEECRSVYDIDFALLSSSVQYLKQPHPFLEKLASFDFKYILFDRTAFINEPSDRLTIQNVPPEIYDASYPSWFFNEHCFMDHFRDRYKVAGEFTSYVEGETVMFIDDQLLGYDKGFYLVNKKYA